MNKQKSSISFKNKKGDPISKRAKSNYPLFKLAMELNLEEISVLITDRRLKIKYENDFNKIMIYKEDILLLEDVYKIKRAEDIIVLNKWRHENTDMMYTTYLSVKISSILTYLGYLNSLYKEEGIKISEKLYNKKFKDSESDLILLSIAIVKEILYHYRAIFEEDKILKLYNIDEANFYDCYMQVNGWCKKNYWRN